MFPWAEGEEGGSRPRSGRRAPGARHNVTNILTHELDERSGSQEPGTEAPRSPAEKIKAHRNSPPSKSQQLPKETKKADAVITDYRKMLQQCKDGLHSIEHRTATGELNPAESIEKRNKIEAIQASLRSKLEQLNEAFSPPSSPGGAPPRASDYAADPSTMQASHPTSSGATKGLAFLGGGQAQGSRLPGLGDRGPGFDGAAPKLMSEQQAAQAKADMISMTLEEQREEQEAYQAAKETQKQMQMQFQARKRRERAQQIDAERKMHARLAACDQPHGVHLEPPQSISRPPTGAAAARSAPQSASTPSFLEREKKLSELCRPASRSDGQNSRPMMKTLSSDATVEEIAAHRELLDQAEQMVHRRLGRIEDQVYSQALQGNPTSAAARTPKTGRRATPNPDQEPHPLEHFSRPAENVPVGAVDIINGHSQSQAGGLSRGGSRQSRRSGRNDEAPMTNGKAPGWWG